LFQQKESSRPSVAGGAVPAEPWMRELVAGLGLSKARLGPDLRATEG
jgi:hypothetical protein